MYYQIVNGGTNSDSKGTKLNQFPTTPWYTLILSRVEYRSYQYRNNEISFILCY